MSVFAVETPVRVVPDFTRQALVQLLEEGQKLDLLARSATTLNDESSWQ